MSILTSLPTGRALAYVRSDADTHVLAHERAGCRNRADVVVVPVGHIKVDSVSEGAIDCRTDARGGEIPGLLGWHGVDVAAAAREGGKKATTEGSC